MNATTDGMAQELQCTRRRDPTACPTRLASRQPIRPPPSRHVRAGNQLASLLAITEREQQADFESHLHFVRTDLTHKLDESNYHAGLDIVGLVDRTQHPELHVIAWFEQIGVRVRTRYLEEAVYLDVTPGRVAFFWDLLSPAVAIRCRCALAAQEREPVRFERLPLDDPWRTDERT